MILALGTGLWVGMIPPRSGTLGSLWGIALSYAVCGSLPWWGAIGVIAGMCLIGVYVCGRSAELLGKEDPREVVFDEIVSMPIVFLFVGVWTWPIIITGFLLHRVWDIAKPLGIYRLQYLPGGWGIMVDDVAAGIAACLSLHLLLATGWFDVLWKGILS